MSQGQTYKPLLSAYNMAQIGEVVARGLQTSVTIERKTSVDSPYGDDEELVWTTIATVMGWLRSTPTPVRVEDSGMVITVNTYRLLLPTGTDVAPGDLVTAADGTFIVSDTTYESTWKPYLQVSLRRRE